VPTNRDVRLSVKDRIKEMLTTPDASMGWSRAWNIYNEANFRAVAAGTFTPTAPFVYLMDSFQEPVTGARRDLMQPQLIVEIETYEKRPFEVGNRAGHHVGIYVQVFGKNRGERDDLGGYLTDFIGDSIDIKAYSAANPTGVLADQALIDDLKKYEDIYTTRADAALSGLVLDWSRVSFGFQMKV
jgi:hypothetical protein